MQRRRKVIDMGQDDLSSFRSRARPQLFVTSEMVQGADRGGAGR
jgi:hypothetical protein